MKFGFALVIAALAVPAVGQSTKEQLTAVQRDIGLLQDQMRTLQRSQDEKWAAMTVLVNQALEAANKATAATSALQANLNQSLGDQLKGMGGSLVGVGNRVDTMSDEFRGVKESVADLAARMNKLDAKLTDISNAVRTLAAAQTPAPAAGGGATGPPPPTAPPSAEAMFDNAKRDYSGGKLDLAAQEFTEYLKWFKQSDQAADAQYYIGDILLRQGKSADAVKAFDAVLEQYPETKITPTAHFMKAKALFQAGQKTAAAQEYCEVIRLYPSNDLAKNSKAAISGMGYTSCGTSTPAGAAKKKGRR